MIEDNNIGEDDILVFCPKNHREKNKKFPWWMLIAITLGIIVVAAIVLYVGRHHNDSQEQTFPYNCQTEDKPSLDGELPNSDIWYNNIDTSISSCIVVTDTILDNIQLQILTPYNATPELHLGKIDITDTDILFAALAADLGSNKGKIIGAFVYNGEPRSWGLSKKGYCAIFNGEITFGVAENSPLFEQATEEGGSFFRQYPAVDNGVMVENNPPNASFRRALCSLNGKVCIIVCTNRVLMNDFSAALVKLGVRNAIFLVGSTEDGWYRNGDGTLVRLGKEYKKNNPNINYLVFRAQ